MKDYKAISEKQAELIEHLKAYYDAQESPAVKLIEPQWHNYLKQLESELAKLQSQADVTDEDIDLYSRAYGELTEGNRNGEIMFAFRHGAEAFRDGKIVSSK
jgi:hypothetical protein